MNPAWIFWPVIVQALVTLWMYVPMSRARVAAVKAGAARASDFRLPNVDEKPETRQLANAVGNQFELPVLFFALCLSVHAAGRVDAVMLAGAWLFVVLKTVHSYVHATSNRLRHRRPVFMAAWLTCIALWLWFAVRLAIG